MSGFDYMAFAQGELVGELASRRNARAWSQHADGLEEQLLSAESLSNGERILRIGAVNMVREMLSIIEQVAPDSSYANKEYVTQRLKEQCMQVAHERDFHLDYDGRRAYPK